jgi:hypothetical protein
MIIQPKYIISETGLGVPFHCRNALTRLVAPHLYWARVGDPFRAAPADGPLTPTLASTSPSAGGPGPPEGAGELAARWLMRLAKADASTPGTYSQQLTHSRCHQLPIYFCISSNSNRPGCRAHGGLEHRSTSVVPQVHGRSGGAAGDKISAPSGKRSDLWLKRRCPEIRRSSHATAGRVASLEPSPRDAGQSMARPGRPTALQARPLP